MTSLQMGGGEKVSVDLMNELISLGYSVHLAVMKYEGIYKNSLSSEVVVHDLKTNRISMTFLYLVRLVFSIRPHKVFASSIHLNPLVIIVSLLRFKKTKAVIRIGSPFSLLFQEYKSWKDKYILLWITKFLYRYADTIICVAESIRDDLRSFVYVKKEKVIVAYSPKESEKIIQKSEEYKPSIFSEKEGPFFLFVGRLTKAKDPATLLSAFALFKSEGRKGTLLFVGDGGLRQNLLIMTQESSLEKDVVFLGPQDNPYVYMKNSDVVVMSSVSEGLPNVLLEALILKKMVVSTDCFPGGAREVLDPKTIHQNGILSGENGYLVPISNPKLLKEVLALSLSHPDKSTGLPQKFTHKKLMMRDVF